MSQQLGQPFGEEKGHGKVFAFVVGLVVSLALPPFMLWLLLHFGDPHGAVGYFILRPLAGAYPFISVLALPVWLAWGLDVLQWCGLSALFARNFHMLTVPGQIVSAILLIVLLAIVGDIVHSILDLELHSSAFFWE